MVVEKLVLIECYCFEYDGECFLYLIEFWNLII